MLTIFCLVSKQSMANVLPVLMYKPNSVILFSTEREKSTAYNLEKLFKRKKINVIHKHGLDAYDYQKFREIVKQTKVETKGEVWLNITGGTKLMALAAYQVFAKSNKKTIYCHTEINEIIQLVPEYIVEKLALDLKVEDYLHAYGYKIASSKPADDYNEYIPLFNIIDKYLLWEMFTNFLSVFRRETAAELNNQTINDKKYKIFSIQKTSSKYILSVTYNNFIEKFIFNDDKFLKGDWLEYFVYNKIKSIGKRVLMGTKIISDSGVENEIDIMFIHNFQLYLISCKSGKPDKNNLTLFEIDTLRGLTGGTYGKGFVVVAGNPSKKTKMRAADLKIEIMNFMNLDKIFNQ